MLRLTGLVKKQAELILSSRKNALLYAVVLTLLPYCTWLAMMVVALITLRKGEQEGGRILGGVMLVHGLTVLTTVSPSVALFNTIILFAPTYLAACALRMTSSWQAVATVMFLLTLVSSVVVQTLIPEWVMSQYAALQSILQASQPDHALVKWLNDASGVPNVVMANYSLGIQLMCAVISVWSTLLMARSLQARLFYPGGFTQELLSFRGNRLSSIVMLLLFGAAWQWNVVAINVLPVLILFYLMAGLSLCASFVMGKKSSRMLLALLILPLLFMPFVVLPLYIVLGLLDSVFNIRLVFCR